jgi:hypothetical protein
MEKKQYAESAQFYKPNDKGTGGALSLSFSGWRQDLQGNYTDGGLYLKIAKQVPGQRAFDWNSGTTLKLNLTDIGALLNMIRTKTKVELFHDAGKFYGSGSMQRGLNVQYNEQYNNFYWSLWKKDGEKTVTDSVAISLGETHVIESLLIFVIPLLLKWDLVKIASPVQPQPTIPSPIQASTIKPLESGYMEKEKEELPDWLKEDPKKLETLPIQNKSKEKTKEEKLEIILELAVLKLGVSKDEAKIAVLEATGLPLIDKNIDAIYAAMILMK